MNSIFSNSFYDYEALPKWNFEVSFIFYNTDTLAYTSTEDSYSKNAIYSEILSESVTNIKIPEMKIDTLVTYLPGFHFAYPAKPGLNGELQITFNDDCKLTIRKIADYLMQYYYNPRYQQQPYFDQGTSTYVSLAHLVCGDLAKNFVIQPKFDIYVKIYNHENDFVQKVVYKNCFVKSIGGIGLDYSSEELVNTQITVSYPYFKVLDTEEDANDYEITSNGMTNELENNVEYDEVPSESAKQIDTNTNETEGPKETGTFIAKKTLETSEEDRTTTTTASPVDESTAEDEYPSRTKMTLTDTTQETTAEQTVPKGDAGNDIANDDSVNPSADTTDKSLEPDTDGEEFKDQVLVKKNESVFTNEQLNTSNVALRTTKKQTQSV